VVATLWNVDDDAATALTANFYRHLAGGASAAEALRQAQLRTMGVTPAREWAAFRVYAGIPKEKRRSK
jgi:CHAT domain-containing protein